MIERQQSVTIEVQSSDLKMGSGPFPGGYLYKPNRSYWLVVSMEREPLAGLGKEDGGWVSIDCYPEDAVEISDFVLQKLQTMKRNEPGKEYYVYVG